MFEKRKLKVALNEIKNKSHVLRLLLNTFELNEYDYAIVGGFVRDTLLEKEDFHDIDIIVDISYENLISMLNNYVIRYRHNLFKGLKIYDKWGEVQIDIWCLNDHRPFTQGFFEKSWKNIPSSAYLNDGGCTWLVNKNKLYLGKTKKLIKNKIVDFYDVDFFHKSNIDNKHIIVAKLLKYYKSDEFKLSDDCMNYLKKYLSRKGHVISVRRFVKNNYGIDVDELVKEIEGV